MGVSGSGCGAGVQDARSTVARLEKLAGSYRPASLASHVDPNNAGRGLSATLETANELLLGGSGLEVTDVIFGGVSRAGLEGVANVAFL